MILGGFGIHILLFLSLHLLVLPRFFYDFLIHLNKLHDDSILFMVRYFPGLATLKLLDLLHCKIHDLYLGRLVRISNPINKLIYISGIDFILRKFLHLILDFLLIPRVLFVSTRVKRGCGYLDSLAARA